MVTPLTNHGWAIVKATAVNGATTHKVLITVIRGAAQSVLITQPQVHGAQLQVQQTHQAHGAMLVVPTLKQTLGAVPVVPTLKQTLGVALLQQLITKIHGARRWVTLPLQTHGVTLRKTMDKTKVMASKAMDKMLGHKIVNHGVISNKATIHGVSKAIANGATEQTKAITVLANKA